MRVDLLLVTTAITAYAFRARWVRGIHHGAVFAAGIPPFIPGQDAPEGAHRAEISTPEPGDAKFGKEDEPQQCPGGPGSVP